MSAPINAGTLPAFQITSLEGLVDRARMLMEEGQDATQALKETAQHLSLVCLHCGIRYKVKWTEPSVLFRRRRPI